jgi:hypothetical protein
VLARLDEGVNVSVQLVPLLEQLTSLIVCAGAGEESVAPSVEATAVRVALVTLLKLVPDTRTVEVPVVGIAAGSMDEILGALPNVYSLTPLSPVVEDMPPSVCATTVVTPAGSVGVSMVQLVGEEHVTLLAS